MEKHPKVFFWNNQNLFSNNYLEHRLPETDLWKNEEDKVRDVLSHKKPYGRQTLKLGIGQEAESYDIFHIILES